TCPTTDNAHVGRDVTLVVGKGFDGEYLARELAYCAATVLMARAGMRGLACDAHLEPRCALARRDDLAAFPCGLRHEHILGVARLTFDNLARCWAADFLVGDKELSDGQSAARTEPRHLAESMKGEECAAFHVLDAWTVGDIAFDFEGQALDESNGVHGVEVRQDQNSAVGRPPTRMRDKVVTKTVAAGDAFEPGAGAVVGMRCVIDHVVYCLR